MLNETFKDNVFAYYFDLPIEETLKRHIERDWHEFGEKEMREWFVEKDFLPNIKEKILTKDMSKDEIVDMIYRDLMT